MQRVRVELKIFAINTLAKLKYEKNNREKPQCCNTYYCVYGEVRGNDHRLAVIGGVDR